MVEIFVWRRWAWEYLLSFGWIGLRWDSDDGVYTWGLCLRFNFD